MKPLRLFTLSIIAQGAWLALPAEAQPVDRPWEALQCSSRNRRDAEDFIDYFRARLRAADAYLQNCGTDEPPTPPPTRNDCIQFVVGKGYGPTTARTTCEGLRASEVECVKGLMNRGHGPSTARSTCEGLGPVAGECVSFMLEKGYGPASARQTCDSLDHASFGCVRYLIEKGYGPASAGQTCAGVNESERECIRDLIERGYGPATARETCVSR